MSRHLRITRTSSDDMKKRYWNKFYHPQRQVHGPIDPEVEVCWGVIQLTTGTDETELETLETAIKAIPGIDTCNLAIGCTVPDADDIPENQEVHATLEGRIILIDKPSL